jgi:hypothetical protein
MKSGWGFADGVGGFPRWKFTTMSTTEIFFAPQNSRVTISLGAAFVAPMIVKRATSAYNETAKPILGHSLGVPVGLCLSIPFSSHRTISANYLKRVLCQLSVQRAVQPDGGFA